VLIETNAGAMTIKLYNTTPKHRDNFIKLVKEGYYNDLLFHRVINNFMIQGGDPDSKNSAQGQMLGGGGPGYTIDPEIGQMHFKGALAAARQGDRVNPQKKSSGSQFYIVHGQLLPAEQIKHMGAQNGVNYTPEQLKKYEQFGGAPFLDGGYTVFGEVVKGLEVIDQIAVSVCDNNNRPIQDIKMKISLIK
jgi:cyclophilin family peptidyl-prolyl cis-trans isomerase